MDRIEYALMILKIEHQRLLQTLRMFEECEGSHMMNARLIRRTENEIGSVECAINVLMKESADN